MVGLFTLLLVLEFLLFIFVLLALLLLLLAGVVYVIAQGVLINAILVNKKFLMFFLAGLNRMAIMVILKK